MSLISLIIKSYITPCEGVPVFVTFPACFSCNYKIKLKKKKKMNPCFRSSLFFRIAHFMFVEI